MFDFLRKRRKPAKSRGGPLRSRGPVTIGFEQLESRELLSTGLVRPIIPTEPRPFLNMPRPYVASFDPEADRAVSVSLNPRREPEDDNAPAGLWPFGGRFRFWID